MIKASGIDVWFPFREAHHCQKVFIQKVIEALSGDDTGQGFNAMLESPAGTGKTICILSACVAYMKQERN